MTHLVASGALRAPRALPSHLTVPARRHKVPMQMKRMATVEADGMPSRPYDAHIAKVGSCTNERDKALGAMIIAAPRPAFASREYLGG